MLLAVPGQEIEPGAKGEMSVADINTSASRVSVELFDGITPVTVAATEQLPAGTATRFARAVTSRLGIDASARDGTRLKGGIDSSIWSTQVYGCFCFFICIGFCLCVAAGLALLAGLVAVIVVPVIDRKHLDSPPSPNESDMAPGHFCSRAIFSNGLLCVRAPGEHA